MVGASKKRSNRQIRLPAIFQICIGNYQMLVRYGKAWRRRLGHVKSFVCYCIVKYKMLKLVMLAGKVIIPKC